MEVKQAIEKKNEAVRNAYDRGDSAGCVSVFLEDAVMLPPDQPMVRGREAIRELIQGWIDNIGGTMRNPMMEYGVEGDLAYQVATYAFESKTAPDEGKFLEIFRRQQDGTWKVYVCIYNSDKPH
jgi:ketosteroid isomerase-like protein